MYTFDEWKGLPPIRVRNTLGNRLEEFKTFEPGIVRMYVCGPTVYDYTHMGHARTYVAFDAIKRYLTLRGYNVFYVQNITDIDDKIINRAKEEGRSWKDVAEEYIKDYMEVLKRLKIVVDLHPRVTHHIKEIIEFVSELIDRGYAYVAPSGSVYFDVSAYPYYGELSGIQNPEQWRQEEEFLKEKKNPYDFVLWRAWKPGEPYWEAPWGKGRPGWHIECSVMSSRYLGRRIDIHGGGQDLIFPHHENEKAQSEALFGRPWVRYWLHTGYLTVRGEKMSKSLGNIVPIREALKKWEPDVLRLWLLSVHYRSQIDYSEDSLEQAKRTLERIRETALDVKRLIGESASFRLGDRELRLLSQLENLRIEFHEAMSTDFNTAKALAAVMKLVRLVNAEILPSENYTLALRAYKLFLEFNTVFAVIDDVFARPATEVEKMVNDLIDLILKVRQELRREKRYELSDWIRSELSRLGVVVMDHPGGKTTWRLSKR